MTNKKENIQKDLWDNMLYNASLRMSPTTQEEIKKHQVTTNADFDIAAKDLYALLYKGKPKTIKLTKDNNTAIRRAIEYIKNSESLKKLRKTTKYNPWDATIASYKLFEPLAKLIKEEQEKMNNENKENEQQKNNEGNGGEKGKANKGKNNQQKTQAQQQIDDAMKNIADETEARQKDIPQPNYPKNEKTPEIGQEQQLQTDGQNNIGDPVKADEIWKRMTMNDSKRNMFKYMGRTKETAQGIGDAKLTSKMQTITGITLGDNIQEITPTERMMLNNQKTKLMMLEKIISRKAHQYEHKAKTKAGQGNIIVLLDRSGSMGEWIQTESMIRRQVGQMLKQDMAIAFTYGLIEAAKKSKRNIIVIPFETEVTKHMEIIMKKGMITEAQIMTLCQITDAGGTNYVNALYEAKRFMESKEFQKETKNADILMITDDDCTMSNQTEEMHKTIMNWKRKGMKIYTIMIQTHKGREDYIKDRMKDAKQNKNNMDFLYYTDKLYFDLEETTFKDVANNIINEERKEIKTL